MPLTAVSRPRLCVALQSPNRLLRESIADRLERDSAIHLVGATATENDLYQLCTLRSAEVAIIDAASIDPSALVRRLRGRFTELRVIALCEDPEVAIALQRAGAHRVVSPSGGLKSLLSALYPYSWIHQESGSAEDSGTHSISDEEVRILHLIGSGHTLEQIAAVLGVTPSAVERLKRRAFGKLAARSQAHAVARALRLGLLPIETSNGRRSPQRGAESRPIHAVLHGTPSPLLSRVESLLGDAGITVEKASEAEIADGQRVRRVAVHVDPSPNDLLATSDLAGGRLIVWSDDPGQRASVEALLQGADAMVPAGLIDSALVPALQLVASGFLVSDADRTHRFLRAGFTRLDQGRAALPLDLTSREQDILTLIERGHTVRQTARELGISIKTVETLQSRLFRKLGVRSSSEAIVVAHGLGLLRSEVPI